MEKIDTGSVAVNDTVNWVKVGTITLTDANLEQGAVQVHVATNPITDFKITRTAYKGGDHIDWYSGSDFNNPSRDLPYISPMNLATMAAGNKGLIRLMGLKGIWELSFWAKGANTNVRVAGTFI